MANEINIILNQPNLSLVAKVYSGGTQIGGDINLTENVNVVGHYYANAPATIPNGEYIILILKNTQLMGALSMQFIDNKRVDGYYDFRIRGPEFAQGGAEHDVIILNANALNNDFIYRGCRIMIIGGTGVGQSGHIITYHGATKRAQVNLHWTTIPDSTSEYVIYPP